MVLDFRTDSEVAARLVCEWQSLRALSRSGTSFDNELLSSAVRDLYEALGMPAPSVVRCKSQLQVLVMPISLQFLLRSPSLWCMRAELVDGSDCPIWRHVWLTLAQHFAADRREKAPLQGTGRGFPANIDAAYEAMIATMADQHALLCQKVVGDKIWQAYLTAFSQQVRRPTLEPLVRQLTNHLLNESTLTTAPYELARHLSNKERLQIAGTFRAERSLPVEGLTDAWRALRLAVRTKFRLDEIWWGVFGQSESEWAVLRHVLATKVFELPADEPRFRSAEKFFNAWAVLLTNAFCWSFYPETAFVCERPAIAFDERGFLHSQSTPALACRDGYQIYSRHGVTIPPDVIVDPGSITVHRIAKERNVEVRRVMIDQFGLQRYLRETGAAVINKDDCGTLYRKEMTSDEAIVMVQVTNSTPEPDGTFKEYFLRVPPDIRTAREAVAWTFGMFASEYLPSTET